MFNIVLHQPEIPQNTGSIGRLCVNNNCKLHLIRPLGFETSDYYLRRSGLDYWEKLNPDFYDDWQDFKIKNRSMRLFLFSTKGMRKHTEVDWQPQDGLVFGSETSGLPRPLIEEYQDSSIRIPMIGDFTRSLNLAQSVAIGLYEGLRVVHNW